MANLPSIKIAENTLKKMKPPQAMAYLSKRYASSQEFEYLLACLDILHHFEDDPTTFHSILWNVKRLAHTYAGRFSEKQINQLLYKKLALKYVRFVDRFKQEITLPNKREFTQPPKRILFLGQQILHRAHAVTMCMLAFAKLARLGGFEDIKILITNEYPSEPASTFHESFWAVPSNVIGETAYTYEGEDISVYSYEKQGFSKDNTQDIVDYIGEYDPDIVFQTSDNIIVGDLIADRYPSVCWPLSQTLPISLAQIQYYRSETQPDTQIDWKRLKKTPPQLLPQKFVLETKSENFNTFTREKLKVDDDAFLFAVVGVRLHQEISSEFADILANILKADSRAHIILIGTDTLDFAPQLKPFTKQTRLIRFSGDLRSCLEQCDAYINPPRQGGGNSAYWAMLEDLPILTLDNCDVQMTIRNDAAVESLAELEALALRVLRDPETRNEYIEKSRERIRLLPTEQQSADTLMHEIDLCIETFNSL
jgi:glycosyltransferase involved in cell wall biosynthesis